MAEIVTVGAGEKGRLLCELWARAGNHATSDVISDVEDAAVVLFGGPTHDALPESASQLAGKIIVDCGNPAELSALRTAPSRAEALAQRYPEARIVKAFNTITADALALVVKHWGPQIGTVYTSAFYCGDDAEAKRVIDSLITEVNLDPIDCGPLSNAVLLDGMGLLGSYLEAHVFDSVFAFSVARPAKDRSPLDRWM